MELRALFPRSFAHVQPSVSEADKGAGGSAASSETLFPLVTAILVVTWRPRINLAQRAIEAFLAQTYPSKQLVIFNGTGLAAAAAYSHELIKEFMISESSFNLGKARNFCIDMADGSWLLSWDDDDYSHPHRIALQMEHRQEGYACVLTHQLRCDCQRMTAVHFSNPEGIPSTLLFPKTAARYPPLQAGEDAAFMFATWRDRCVILDNRPTAFPNAACLSIAFHHGANVLGLHAFMPGFTASNFDNTWVLPREDSIFLREVLLRYGYQTEAVAREAPTEEVIPGSMA